MPTEAHPGRTATRLFFAFVGASVLILALFVGFVMRVTPGDPPRRITASDFRQIHPGMTRDQVIDLIGQGDQTDESRMSSGTWSTETWGDGKMVVTYHDGIVDHATQFSQ